MLVLLLEAKDFSVIKGKVKNHAGSEEVRARYYVKKKGAKGAHGVLDTSASGLAVNVDMAAQLRNKKTVYMHSPEAEANRKAGQHAIHPKEAASVLARVAKDHPHARWLTAVRATGANAGHPVLNRINKDKPVKDRGWRFRLARRESPKDSGRKNYHLFHPTVGKVANFRLSAGVLDAGSANSAGQVVGYKKTAIKHIRSILHAARRDVPDAHLLSGRGRTFELRKNKVRAGKGEFQAKSNRRWPSTHPHDKGVINVWHPRKRKLGVTITMSKAYSNDSHSKLTGIKPQYTVGNIRHDSHQASASFGDKRKILRAISNKLVATGHAPGDRVMRYGDSLPRLHKIRKPKP